MSSKKKKKRWRRKMGPGHFKPFVERVDTTKRAFNVRIDEGRDFAQRLVQMLIKRGWIIRHAENSTVELYEISLCKESRYLWVTSAVYDGPFTVVELKGVCI